MPNWIYHLPSWLIAVGIVTIFETVSILGLFLARRYLLPLFCLNDSVNDAVGGTIQAIGVFYGITVGLIAVGVWDNYAHASGLVSQEAANIGALYRDVSSYPEPIHGVLQRKLKAYTQGIIEQDWPTQMQGQLPRSGAGLLTDFQKQLTRFEPATEGQKALHAEALRAFNNLVESRRLRLDAVTGALSGILWLVIWIGAAISISVGYLFHMEDGRLHGLLVGLMAGFLGIVVFLIIANDRPFMGDTSVSPESYKIVMDVLMKED